MTEVVPVGGTEDVKAWAGAGRSEYPQGRVVGEERGREMAAGDGPWRSLGWTQQNLLSHCRPSSLLLSEGTAWKGFEHAED